jgi:hypothetical protein
MPIEQSQSDKFPEEVIKGSAATSAKMENTRVGDDSTVGLREFLGA